MMDIQESEEDMEKVKCERGGSHMTPSPASSFMSIKSDQSMDRPIALNRGAQSYIGEKVRLNETPSPALSHLSMRSDQSMDRPIAFNNEKQNYMGERLRSDETPSPAPSHLSMRSDQSMDRPFAFNNGKQNFMGENLRLAETPSPAPSHLSVKSDQSMDWPIAFRNGTPDTGLRLNEAPSPSASYFSLKSNQSMDRPIAFKDDTRPYGAKRLRLEETPSPTPSFQSMKSHQSMDWPIAFGLRPDEAPSPATSYLSLRSNQSMDRPIAFKDRTETYGAKKVLHVAPSPAPSLMSVKSDQSMDRPIAFSSRARNYMTESLNEPYEATSPAPSLTSLKSEQSMDLPIAFRNKAHSHEIRSTLSATLLTEDHYRCSVCTEVFKDPVSIPCGHSYCKHCIEIYWSKPAQPQGYACPQCRKRFRDRPVLNVNQALTKVIEELLKAGFSPVIPAQCYAGPEDVPCDICTEMKLKAVKSCLTCTASYCETHIRQHYTIPALQRHNLVKAIILPGKEEEKSQDEIRDLVTRVTELEATSKRLCKRFEIHCNDFPSDVIEMAALGRPLRLGMLYDNQTNSFCQDIFKWDEDMLACLKVSLPRPQTHVKVLENDSPHERFRVLEMSPVLQVGTQTGQIKMNGAAFFLNHPEQSQYQERATLHYRTTTRLDMISQRHLQEFAPSAVFGQTTASHVIIAVYYGAQAFFVFDSSGSNHDKNTKIADVLKTLTNTFCSNHIMSCLNAAEKAKSSSFSCSLYIDVGDWKSPVSFDKAVDIYGSLPILLGSKGEKAIPLKVWLYPLEKLVKSPVHALCGVSENLKHQVENVLEHLRKQIIMCQDMITDFVNVKVTTWFPTLEDKLIQFTELLQEYQTSFQKGITETVHIKEGNTEKSLQKLLERHKQSPFSAEKTNQWLENKETELKILNDCRAADIPVVKSQAELQQIISDPQITRVMCLTLFSPNSEDSFLTALKNHSKFDHIVHNDSLMFRPINIDQKLLIKVQLFIAANEDPEQTKFIATSTTGDDFPEYSVQFYHYGRIESRNVTFGTKLDFAQPILVKHTSLSLKLKPPHNKSIESYMVEHRDLGDDGRNSTWKRIKFGFRETCLISDLNPGHQYQLRYIFGEQDCMTFSRITNFQTAVAATPEQPFVDRLSRDSLRVMWQMAEADCPVLHYMVEYKEAGLEGWSSVLTQGPECECILTLPHSTCYRVRVSAVYEEITSKPSEETSVPVNVWYINLSERKSYILLEVLKLQTEKKPVELIDCTDEESEVRGFLQCLPYISQLRFDSFVFHQKKSSFQLLVKISVAASKSVTTRERYTEMLKSVCSYTSFPFSENYIDYQSGFLLDLYSHVKDYENQTGRSVLPALQPVYETAPAVWRIKLSERKSSILLEVLKLQTEKKPVELLDWTDEESALRGFFQCLPYISQLRFHPQQMVSFSETEIIKRLMALNLSFQAPDLPNEIIATSMETLFSYMYYGNWNFLLELYSHVKDFENKIGRSILPALQPVYQSAPAVWSINLSERKSSILLEVLKLQTEKKPVELIDCTDEESEVRGFLQCLPYISQLRFNVCLFTEEKQKTAFQFLVKLSVAASEYEASGESFTFHLISACSYSTFPFDNITYVECQCDFLLDLYSHWKDYESQTGRSVLPALQSVYQSAPAVWRIKLSERKSSILLEVLKLQTEKKPVQLMDWTDEESEVRGFLQCLPYISQLRLPFSQNEYLKVTDWRLRLTVLDMCLRVPALQKEVTKTSLETLYSYITYGNCNFLLDLYTHMKAYANQTRRDVFPALKVIYQSAPAVWSIDLSERKSSILLEVLKLQTEKKPVELIDWTDEESEVRGFLQCLPYISQLRFGLQQNGLVKPWEKRKRLFMMNLCLQAALDPKNTVNTVLLKLSLVSYERSDFLLDLYSHLKDFESQTGRIVLPTLQPVYQSAPAVWRTKLSERKSSILLEVLKLQTEKKPVELIDWTDEESEVRGFLQCLPYISQLRFAVPQNKTAESWEKRKRSFIMKLSLQAALHQKEKIEETVNKLLSSVEYKRSVFLLDLCSYVKDYESQTGRSVLPDLKPVYQSAPAVWRMNLSERKSSILLEVLKLQTVKKPVELIDCTDEESELRGFLLCLPYISQLRFVIPRNKAAKSWEKIKRLFILNLCLQAAVHQEETIEEAVKTLLSSVNYEISAFLLDLCSHVKNYESQTGRSVLPALQPVYQSLSTVWSIKSSIKKGSILLEVLKLQTEKKPVELIDWTDEESEVRGFLQCLPYISQLRFDGICYKNREIVVKFLWKLFVSASEYDTDMGENYTELLTSACSYTSFPYKEFFFICRTKQSNFLLDLWSHAKNYESQTGRTVLPALQPVYHSAPAVWSINLSERKSSILLEVLKLQTEKKPVELIDCTDEESEVRGFLQCLPYISQLRIHEFDLDGMEKSSWFLLNLTVAALKCVATTEENYIEMLTSVCSYRSFFHLDDADYAKLQTEHCSFLLDLCLHVKEIESQTGRSFLPELQSFYQSAPAVWRLNLSERKSSILLEVLKLQTEKKTVELIDWTDEESEVRGFLQCLPYISQLRIHKFGFKGGIKKCAQFLLNLTVEASKCVTTTGENYIKLLPSVCSYRSFLCLDDDDDYPEFQTDYCDFLLDQWSHMKDYESQTGRSVHSALQPVYQSAPEVWRIKLSERKSSILLEVLKLQTEKKPVELIDCTDEESEVRGFLQCLPYISQLRFVEPQNKTAESWEKRKRSFILDLSLQAALHQKEKIKETVNKLLSSVKYERSDFLLDLCSHVKDYESKTGRNVLPALQPVYQSAPAVWRINLSERKSSILLEVLKLQTVKKPVELIDCTDEESEVRGFLQCLPYISQLRIHEFGLDIEMEKRDQFLLNLTVEASKCVATTGENYIELLTSVCNYRSFLCLDDDDDDDYPELQTYYCDFLLDLCSHVKDYESQTGRSVLPALQPVYQSAAPAVWRIKLSERKSSILLEVLKLQTEKKPVELMDCTDEESEARGFLQCLPYISQLRIHPFHLHIEFKKRAQFLLNLTVEASKCFTTTGENYIELLTSVCSYRSFVCFDDDDFYQEYQSEHCDFLLDLCSHVKDIESKTGRSVLPALQPVYQSAPAVWSINLSKRKSSILLEVLKLQTEKKPVELIYCTDEESEVRGFLHCLPYISQLRLSNASVKLLLSLIVSASELDANTQGNYTELLTSACCYTSFPFDEIDDDYYNFYQCDFLLDLYSHVKDYESQTGRSVLPALQPVYQSAPAVWSINLLKRKSSILLEVLKLQTEKKPVELLDWTEEESEVRGFLQCLPYISELRNADQHFPSLCKMFGPRVKADQFTPLLQALNFTVTLSGKLPSSTCRSVSKVLSLSPSKLNLTLNPWAISLRGLKLLFRHITHLQTLSLEHKILVKMVKALRSFNDHLPLTTEELSLITNGSKQNRSHILSSLTSLLRLMSVQSLDLTQCKSEALSLTALLALQDPIILRFSKETLQQLVLVVYEAQDDELTLSFIKKTSKDLTSCSLTWEMIHYLLQHGALNLKVDFRKSKTTLENVKELLPVLNKVQLKRLTPSFTLSIITEIYETRSTQFVSSLLSSAGNYINLNGRVLDSVHCAALRFTLEHCNTVKLNLLWTSIPEEELKSFLPLLNRVTQLSVDRLLLLKLLHCCSSSDVQQEAAAALLSALQHRLDFSCSTALDLTDTWENQEHFKLSIEDSKIISSVLQKTQSVVKLILKDCELSNEALKQLWPILTTVQLSCSKALLLQFLACISKDGAESSTVRSAKALSQALGGEMDLSHTQMDQRSCEQLAVFLEYSEGLTELDLSHCKLTDQCMEPLLPHLHKTQTLDLSHNNITDESANKIHSIVSNHSNIQTVRLFGNRINDRKQFIRDKRFEIW